MVHHVMRAWTMDQVTKRSQTGVPPGLYSKSGDSGK